MMTELKNTMRNKNKIKRNRERVPFLSVRRLKNHYHHGNVCALTSYFYGDQFLFNMTIDNDNVA